MIEHSAPLVVANSVTHCAVSFSPSPGSFPLSRPPTSCNHMPNKPPACKSLSQILFSVKLRIKIPCVEVQSKRS